MLKRLLSTLLLLGSSLFLGCLESSNADFAQHPVIIVDIDTLRADHLGTYGYERPTSPAIDLFANDAAVFQWTFSQAPNTPPSQSSILTSLYPSSHGRIGDKQVLSESVLTLAEIFSSANYQTAAFVDGGLMASGFGLEQGFSIYDDEAGGVKKIGPKAQSWLTTLLSENERTHPPFLLIHTYDVHSPYENSPDRFRSMFLDGIELPSEPFRANMSANMADVWKARREDPPPQLGPKELEYAIAMYDSGIRHVDDWFGEFIDFLKMTDLYDQSIVVVISDHGDAFQEHETLFHEQIYSSVARVPLIIKLPYGRFAGTFESTAKTIDLMPTLLEVLDLPIPSNLQGSSLVPILEKRQKSIGVAVTESPFRGGRTALATSRFRLVHTRSTNETELYDYRVDPLEQVDISAENQETVRRLRKSIRRWRKQVRDHSFETAEIEGLSEETVEQLRTLGYID